MKLTTARLKQLIREELGKVDEAAFMQQRSGMSMADKAQQLEQELIMAMVDSGRADEAKAMKEITALKDRVEMSGADSKAVTIQHNHMKVYYSLDGKLLRNYISYL